MGTRDAKEWWFMPRQTSGMRSSVGILALPFRLSYPQYGLKTNTTREKDQAQPQQNI